MHISFTLSQSYEAHKQDWMGIYTQHSLEKTGFPIYKNLLTLKIIK